MTGFRGTSGPWPLNGPVQKQNGFAIYAPAGNGHLVVLLDGDNSPKQYANARAIAAVPETLSDLRDIANISAAPSSSSDHARLHAALDALDKARAIARAALKKALGEGENG